MKTAASKGARKRPTARKAASKVAENSPPYVSQVCYVESSALVAAILEGDDEALRALRGSFGFVTSELTLAECHRALVRAMTAGRLSSDQALRKARVLATFSNQAAVLPVSSHILERAGKPFMVEPVRTLDAIHLASMDSLEGPSGMVTVLTRDQRIRSNATAMGFSIA